MVHEGPNLRFWIVNRVNLLVHIMKSSAPTFWKFGGHAEYMIIHRLQFEMGPSKSTGIEVRKVFYISAPLPIPYTGAERPTGCQRTDRTPVNFITLHG